MGAQVSRDFRREQFGEQGSVRHAKLFRAVDVEQIVFMDTRVAVSGAHGGQSVGEFAVESVGVGRGGVPDIELNANLPAKPGEICARGAEFGWENGGCCGQNSPR